MTAASNALDIVQAIHNRTTGARPSIFWFFSMSRGGRCFRGSRSGFGMNSSTTQFQRLHIIHRNGFLFLHFSFGYSLVFCPFHLWEIIVSNLWQQHRIDALHTGSEQVSHLHIPMQAGHSHQRPLKMLPYIWGYFWLKHLKQKASPQATPFVGFEHRATIQAPWGSPHSWQDASISRNAIVH